MKNGRIIIIFVFLLITTSGIRHAYAQCSICTKTAMQLGDKPAKGLNEGVLYLALVPFAIAGYVGYRWWKNESL